MTARLATVLALAISLAAMQQPVWAAPAPAGEELPVPPIPPANPPSDAAAPVPNVDLYAPPPDVAAGPELRGTLNAGPLDLPGGDPVPGTTYRYDQQQKHQFIPNPGIKLVVPLEK